MGANEALVMDVMEWPDSLTTLLKERHPFLITCVESAPDSLSGFAVRIHLDSTEEICKRIGVVCAIISVLAAVCAYCLDLFSQPLFYTPRP